MRTSPLMVLFVVSLALFVEELLYGLVAPLTQASPAHIQDEHTISILYGAYALGTIAATPILGVITDRIGRRKPMEIGVILLSVSAILFCIGTNPAMHFIARVLQGIGAACTWTAGLALVAEYFVKDRVRAMGFAMLGATTGSIVGPMVGGQLFQLGGYVAPFNFAFAILALDAVFVYVFTPFSKPKVKKTWRETGVELGGIVTDKSVLAAAFAVALAGAGWALMEPLFPMHVTRVGQASPASIGVGFTVSNLVYAFLAPVVGWISDHLGTRQTTAMGLALTAIALPLLALTPNITLATLVLCLVTVGYACTINPTSAELGDAVDRRGSTSYSVAYAIYNLAYSVGMIAADAYVEFFTEAAHKLELLQLLLVMSGLFLLCIPLFLRKPRVPAPTVVPEVVAQD